MSSLTLRVPAFFKIKFKKFHFLFHLQHTFYLEMFQSMIILKTVIDTEANMTLSALIPAIFCYFRAFSTGATDNRFSLRIVFVADKGISLGKCRAMSLSGISVASLPIY